MCRLTRREVLRQAQVLAVGALAAACAPAQTSESPAWWQQPASKAPLAFVDVTVVPMDQERTIPRQTVLVRDGRIAEMRPADAVRLTARVVQVDGRSRYLMPGLADMHVHFNDPQHGLLFLANGVTSVRNMWGFPVHLSAPAMVDNGELIAPTVYTTGPLTDGSGLSWSGRTIVNTAVEAEANVEAQHAAGFRSVKIYDDLIPDAYRATVDAARRLEMSVVGHVPSRVGLQAVLTDGQRSIEHVYGYFNAIRDTSGATVATLAQLTRDAGTWNCPTLTLAHLWAPAQSASHRAILPGVRFLTPRLLDEWRSRNVFIGSEAARFMLTQVRALRDVGAPLLLGTDTPNPWIVPGFAIHEELQQLANAGLTPFEALCTGTRDAARFLGLEHEFGTVAPGKRADLMLLDANPLTEIANVARRAGVMARGRWYAEHELRARLGALERSLASP